MKTLDLKKLEELAKHRNYNESYSIDRSSENTLIYQKPKFIKISSLIPAKKDKKNETIIKKRYES